MSVVVFISFFMINFPYRRCKGTNRMTSPLNFNIWNFSKPPNPLPPPPPKGRLFPLSFKPKEAKSLNVSKCSYLVYTMRHSFFRRRWRGQRGLFLSWCRSLWFINLRHPRCPRLRNCRIYSFNSCDAYVLMTYRSWKEQKQALEGRWPGLPFRPRTESFPSSLTLLSVVGRH